MFEDTKFNKVVKIRKSKKYKLCNGQTNDKKLTIIYNTFNPENCRWSNTNSTE